MHPESKDIFKYHCSAGPWDLKKSQGRHLQILTKEEKTSPSHLQSVRSGTHFTTTVLYIPSVSLVLSIWLNVKECYLPCLL